MASRNIASMHMFLEMKQKFPDLPEDTLRNYSLLYSKDKDKCVSLLQKESENHFHTSQPFSEARLLPNKAKSKTGAMKININQDLELSNCDTTLLPNNCTDPKPAVSSQISTLKISGRSTSHANILQMPLKKANNSQVPCQSEVKSAPVLSQKDKPFSTIYKEGPFSSHTTVYQIPQDLSDNRMMFSTTKEHIIMPVEALPEDGQWPEDSQKHSVSLSMTPSFPFPQQQMSVYSSSISTTGSSLISKSGKHTTSLNLQLQPETSDSYPIEVSTIPTNLGSPSNFKDFSSHLQISVGTQGATFTALRLQRPNPRSVSEQQVFTFSQSSQPQSSRVLELPSSPMQDFNASSIKENDFLCKGKHDLIYDSDPTKTVGEEPESSLRLPTTGELDAQTNFSHGFQASPDYMKAVKQHQLARLSLVKEELEKDKSACSKLKSTIEKLEQEVARRERRNSFSYAELLQKLKEENRKLRLECNCLLMEYDVSSKGQIPVGVTDEDFYSNIFTGPNDGLLTFYANGERKKLRENSKRERKPAEEDEEENSRWKCNNCTFANHPALEKCEMCELPKNLGSFFDDS